MTSRALLLALALAGPLAGGCHTAVGNYFGNRARDLGECVCVDVAAGLGLSVGVKAAGLLHYGLGGGVTPNRLALAWEYGHGCAFGVHTGPALGADRGEMWLPIPLPGVAGGGHGPAFSHLETMRGRHVTSHRGPGCGCVAVLPAVVDPWATYLPPTYARSRWHWVHAFDVEGSVFAGVVCARVGFSPGEFVDFVLGWFGVDIAGDDRVLAVAADRE